MFSMLTGLPDGGLLSKDRLLEATEDHVKDELNISQGNFGGLINIPTLAMPEFGPGDSPSLMARVGALSRIAPMGQNYQVTFTPDPQFRPLKALDVYSNRELFGFDSEWSLHRTRLSVKDIDLYRTLYKISQPDGSMQTSHKYLNFPDVPTDDNLVVVMMPFKSEFDPIWEAIQGEAFKNQMNCLRADSIWDENSILDDIVSLIWRARIVITDYSDSNANVFYETGIAHTLGRECIPIIQDIRDIPFDLRHLRTLKYDTSDMGINKMKLELGRRIKTILGRV